jgi:catechol 2,3-dioxygenase-like lactoylglutathione lyase family enzyme
MALPSDIIRAATYLPVRDVVATATYYRDVLGFRCEYEAGTPPEFAIYVRGAATLMLRRVATRVVPSEAQGGTWDVFCWVTDLDALFQELRGKDATVVYPPTLQPYGVREFAIRDCDGHVLGFGETPPGRP